MQPDDALSPRMAVRVGLLLAGDAARSSHCDSPLRLTGRHLVPALQALRQSRDLQGHLVSLSALFADVQAQHQQVRRQACRPPAAGVANCSATRTASLSHAPALRPAGGGTGGQDAQQEACHGPRLACAATEQRPGRPAQQLCQLTAGPAPTRLCTPARQRRRLAAAAATQRRRH